MEALLEAVRKAQALWLQEMWKRILLQTFGQNNLSHKHARMYARREDL